MPVNFKYSSLKELLKDTNAEVLLPNDGEAYEKSIERWSEHCIKRAVSLSRLPYLYLSAYKQQQTRLSIAFYGHYLPAYSCTLILFRLL